MEAIQFEIVNSGSESHAGYLSTRRRRENSLKRLVVNSEHITRLFSVVKELRSIRFDELELLRDLRELVETESQRFDKIKEPAEFRREIRSRMLPRYLSTDFIQMTQKKLMTELMVTTQNKQDQDALLTAMIFLQSHTEIGIPVEENPLWEIIFNLSLKDGIRFVDSLTAFNEGLDTLKSSDPSALYQEPPVLQFTKDICEWPIFWKKLVNSTNIQAYEDVVSAILRGELIINFQFDEICHLPLNLFRIYNDVHQAANSDMSSDGFIPMTDEQREEVAQDLLDHINRALEADGAVLIPALKTAFNQINFKKSNVGHGVADVFQRMKDLDMLQWIRHPIIITLMVAKISSKKYWDNKLDYFFLFTIMKNPEDPQNYFEYSQILIKLKKYNIIEHLLHLAIELDKNTFWGYWGLGTYYLRKNDLEACETNLSTALKLAQHLEIESPGRYRRELFLIKEDIRRLNCKKIKKEARSHEQITLF
ncbi:hypothetical protein JXB12_09860 [candidate division KSB1 bacterium]|nr:hypothetical protein [candidate division KSB1 bacterium]